mmetsp:Transcript_44202/g.92295  ORF Transcript_44202/g.92295 Transcript_44202/m.92295 type:complete len:379 (-) Transcript_44202:3-1139(-)
MGKKSGGKKGKPKPVQTVKSLKAKAKGPPGKAKAESLRQQARHEAKASSSKRGRRAHGKEEAINETRQRLRAKLLQRQLTRGPAAKPGEERRGILVELAGFQTEAGQQRSAIRLLQEALDMSPEDTDFQVRTPLLALYMDRAMTEEASSMLKGPLFEIGADAEAASNAKREAATVGLYSLALLSYIKIHVLQDCKKKDREGKKAEVLQRLQAAHRHNPFVAEYIAFAPAFEQDFPLGCELPPAASDGILERKLLEALRYCCQLGGRGQIPVWQDAGPFVRKFVREALFEGEAEDGSDPTTDVKNDQTEVDEPPPLPLLPPASSQEPPVLTRWRRARGAAMQLWASDIATEAGLGEGQEECEEEEVSFTDDDAVDDDVC